MGHFLGFVNLYNCRRSEILRTWFYSFVVGWDMFLLSPNCFKYSFGRTFSSEGVFQQSTRHKRLNYHITHRLPHCTCRATWIDPNLNDRTLSLNYAFENKCQICLTRGIDGTPGPLTLLRASCVATWRHWWHPWSFFCCCMGAKRKECWPPGPKRLKVQTKNEPNKQKFLQIAGLRTQQYERKGSYHIAICKTAPGTGHLMSLLLQNHICGNGKFWVT